MLLASIILASGLWLASAQHLIVDEQGNWTVHPAIDEKAAPWWEQQDEAARRKCQSSCTMHSKGVKNPNIALCDDTNVSFLNLWVSYVFIKKGSPLLSRVTNRRSGWNKPYTYWAE